MNKNITFEELISIRTLLESNPIGGAALLIANGLIIYFVLILAFV